MHFDSDALAPYLHARPSPALFALITFTLGSQWLGVETDRWLPSRPSRHQRICQLCHMQVVEDEQHFLLDCPLYTLIRDQHPDLFGYNQGSICLFLERNADQISAIARYIRLCCYGRMSDESHLAPHPGLYIILIDEGYSQNLSTLNSCVCSSGCHSSIFCLQKVFWL